MLEEELLGSFIIISIRDFDQGGGLLETLPYPLFPNTELVHEATGRELEEVRRG